jgi:hypothetical protein
MERNATGWVTNGEIVPRDTLLAQALFFVTEQPHADAEDVAEHLEISLLEAIDITDELLSRGMLDFA